MMKDPDAVRIMKTPSEPARSGGFKPKQYASSAVKVTKSPRSTKVHFEFIINFPWFVINFPKFPLNSADKRWFDKEKRRKFNDHFLTSTNEYKYCYYLAVLAYPLTKNPETK